MAPNRIPPTAILTSDEAKAGFCWIHVVNPVTKFPTLPKRVFNGGSRMLPILIPTSDTLF